MIFKLKDFASRRFPHIFCIANEDAETVHFAAIPSPNQVCVMLWPGIVPRTSGVRMLTVYRFNELQMLRGLGLVMSFESGTLSFPDLNFSVPTEDSNTRPYDVAKFVGAVMDPIEPGDQTAEIYGAGWEGINRWVSLFDTSAGLRVGCNGPGTPLIVEGIDHDWRIVTMIERLSG